MKTHSFLLFVFVCGLALPAASAPRHTREATETDLAESLCAMGWHVGMTVAGGKVCVESVSAGPMVPANSTQVESLSKPLFEQLKKLRYLRKLFLNCGNNGELSPAITRSFAALQSVREMELHGTIINDEIMPYVCSLTNLESLSVWDVSIGEQGIAQLPGLKSLKSLHLWTRKAVSPRSVETIARLPELEYLQIAGDIEEGAFSALKTAAKLETVAVGGPRGVQLLAELHGVATIRRVEIMRAEVDAVVAERVRAIRNLSSLKLECCVVTPEAAKILTSLSLHQIECVQLRNHVLGDLAKGMQEGYGNLDVGH